MERDTLSMRQLMAILWAGLLGPAAERLPGTAARVGGAGGLGLAALGGVMLLSGWIFWRLTQGSGSLAQGFLDAFGGVVGKLVLFIYMVWCQLLLTVRLRQSAQRLLSGGQRDGAAWFFIIVLAMMALWLARGRMGAFGRTGELMFVGLAVTGCVVLALALFQVRGENLMGTWGWNGDTMRDLVLPGSSVLGYGIFAAFLMQPKTMRAVGRKWVGWTVLGCLALILAQTIALGVFGPVLTGRMPSPFFQLAKGVGMEGAFQRIESVVAAVWTFSDLILLGGLLWAVRKIGRVLWPNAPGHSVVTASALAGVVLGVALFGEKIPIRTVTEWVLPVGGLIAAVGVPLLAIVTKRTKGYG